MYTLQELPYLPYGARLIDMKTFWNGAFSLFFIALACASLAYLAQEGKLLTSIALADFVLLSLATFRLVRLFTYDHITESLRSIGRDRPGTFLGTVHDLLACPWCTGIWFAFLMYLGYALSRDFAMPVILILSIAALASVFQIFANLVGWNAEDAKLDVTNHRSR